MTKERNTIIKIENSTGKIFLPNWYCFMENEIFHSIVSRLKPHTVPIVIACAGLVLIGYGLIVFMNRQSASDDISFETQNTDKSSVKKIEGNLMVDIEGAVQKPGVYRLKTDARIQDVLVAAGGFSTDADVQWTQHSLNLAAKVSDGMKIYIPKVGEETPLRSESYAGQAGGSVAGVSTNGLISVNNASAKELEDLPGIGPVTAGKIIDNRPYGSIDELMSKKAVGKATFEKIRELIAL